MSNEVARPRQSGSAVNRRIAPSGGKNGIFPAGLAAVLGLLVAAAPAQETPVSRTRVRPSAGGAGFGTAVVLDGRTLVVGANVDGSRGEVFVLERSARDPDRWVEVARLAPESVGPYDLFGSEVAVSGNTLVAATGGTGENPGAWIYQRNNGTDGTWAEAAELRPAAGSFTAPGGVAIDGDIAAVGDRGADALTGAVYLFARDEGGPNRWGEMAKLVPAGAATGSWFGASVAFAGDTLVAGAPFDSLLAPQAGAAYVFQRAGDDPAGWLEVARLSVPEGEDSALFALSVDLDGDTIVVGAPLNGDPWGVAYIFERDLGGAGRWGQAARIHPTGRREGNSDEFGHSVAVHGDQVLVGAPGDDDLCPTNPYCATGAAYLFNRNRGGDGAWGLLEKVYPQGRIFTSWDEFGDAVALDSTSAVVGIPGRNSADVYRRLFPPLLSLSGSCPGTITVSVSGATPDGLVTLFGSNARGSTVLPPSGPCPGTALGLEAAALVDTARADASGAGSVAHVVPADRCGSFLQAVDVASCSAGNVPRVP